MFSDKYMKIMSFVLEVLKQFLSQLRFQLPVNNLFQDALINKGNLTDDTPK